MIDLGGAPDGDRRGFRYWKDPGAMNTFPGIGNDNTARFAALFSCFVNACFAYGGSETVILTAAECTNPTKQIPRAARRVIYRILFFCQSPTEGRGIHIVLTRRHCWLADHRHDVSGVSQLGFGVRYSLQRAVQRASTARRYR